MTETLDPMMKQSKVVAILSNADQAAEISSLVEDIRDAIMDYQVYPSLTTASRIMLMQVSLDFYPAGN